MRTVIYGSEDLFSSHKIIDNRRVAIVVDSYNKEVNVVFPEGEVEDRIFDYGDWLDLECKDEAVKTVKYQCMSKASPHMNLKEGTTAVDCDNLLDGFNKLNQIMLDHKDKGDKIVYRNRHSMKVAVHE